MKVINNLVVGIFAFLAISTQTSANKIPIKTPIGLYFPGRGCGGSSEIKYLHTMPRDTSGLECTFIVDKTLGEKSGQFKKN
jgi:hypothetical protein